MAKHCPHSQGGTVLAARSAKFVRSQAPRPNRIVSLLDLRITHIRADGVVVAPSITVRADLAKAQVVPEVVVRAEDDGPVGYLVVEVEGGARLSLALRSRHQARALVAALAELDAALDP